MANIYTSAYQLIGKTPLMELCCIAEKEHLQARLLVKLEAFNPGGSAKDRVALAMIRDAEEKGLLKEGSVIIEPTSGNTGIGLACVAAARGYKTVIVMPDSMSMERRSACADPRRAGDAGRHRQSQRTGRPDPRQLHPRSI